MILPFDSLRKYQRQTVLVDGSFDVLHAGHISYFRAAASLGYSLLCNICPDEYTAKKHPILVPVADRAAVLDAIGLLPYVHISDRPTVDVLRQLHPYAYVKGTDWLDKLPKEIGEVCAELKIDIKYTATVSNSSTGLLNRLRPDVDAFEELVLNQQPSAAPWEPTAAVPYDLESRRKAEGPHAELVRDVFGVKRVVDAGCGPGHFVRMLREHGMDVYAFDAHYFDGHVDLGVYRADLLTIHEHCFYGGGDYDAPMIETLGGQDLAICREVFEHLTIKQIPVAVRNLCSLTNRFAYVTTRFSQARHFLDFATSDDLDPTHISIMPQDWLRHLFVLEGFKRRADLEERMDWKGLNRVLVYERAA